jgi:hypothetical protein
MSGTGAASADWQAIAQRRLAQLAAIARIGAEPRGDVLAIIQGTQPSPDAGTSDTSTGYHASADALRRAFMADYQGWDKIRARWSPLRGNPDTSPEADGRAAADAYVAALTAGQYAYVLAAVLGVAEREFGPQTARRLASLADNLLENGDDRDLNADVRPGAPLPPPTPAEQAAAGQLALDDLDPARA